MDDLHNKCLNLKARVIKAFENVSIPKGLVAEHECEECFEIRKNFTGKEWQTITSEMLEENYDKLPLLSPEAYHCFLPAYLINSLNDFRNNANLDGNLVWEFTGYNFHYYRKGKSEPNSSDINYYKSRYQNFSKEQLYTIYDFIDLLIQEEDENDEESIIELKRGKQILIDYVEPNLEI